MMLDPAKLPALPPLPAPPAPLVEPYVLMGLVVLAILVVASAITFALGRLRPGLRLDEIWLKIRSWWFMGPLFWTAVAFDMRIGCLFIGVLCFLSLQEYFTLIPTTAADRGAVLFAYGVLPVQFYFIYTGWFAMFAIFIPVYLGLFIPVRQVLAGETTDFVDRTGRITWGLGYFAYGLSHMAFLLTLAPTEGGVGGRELLMYLVFLTQINDVCQFVWGKTFGRTKIAPRISPNKTWEGFLGGIASTSILSVLIRFATPFSPGVAFVTGLGIGIAGFLGDLTVAAVKRDAGVKDASNIIPGHGGILDRVNSLTFTAPLFLHYVRYFYY